MCGDPRTGPIPGYEIFLGPGLVRSQVLKFFLVLVRSGSKFQIFDGPGFGPWIPVFCPENSDDWTHLYSRYFDLTWTISFEVIIKGSHVSPDKPFGRQTQSLSSAFGNFCRLELVRVKFNFSTVL